VIGVQADDILQIINPGNADEIISGGSVNNVLLDATLLIDKIS
jgi:hypothetical protein